MRCTVTDTPHGSRSDWWTLRDVYHHMHRLPTFLLPTETRRGDTVDLQREGGQPGFWRPTRVLHRTRLW